MREYELKIRVKLDDEGYILKKNWIYDAIAEQLEDDEEITMFKIRDFIDDGEAPKFKPSLD